MDVSINMSEKQFEEFMHQQIPITKEMGFSVEEFKPWLVRIAAKLGPNRNFNASAFGGSINSLMSVCGWALTLSNIMSLDPDVRVVLQKSSIEYIKPVGEDFVAKCEMTNNEKRDRFFKTFKQLGKARLEVHVLIKENEEVMARFRGLYVVFK